MALRQQNIQDLPCFMENAGKRVEAVPWPAAFLMAAVVPVWAVTVLPLFLTYQVGRAAVNQLVSTPVSKETNLDSGYVVKDNQIIPRKDRKYDVILLGATGYTGKLAMRHMAMTYGVGKTVKWAIAGRSAAKLQQVKKKLAEELQMNDLLELTTIIVDTSIPSNLPRLVSQTRVVATTAGPYSKHGSPVVEFCAKFGTHYVDITGETPWVKAMIVQWQETAQKTGSKLVPFCGHDSVPWDISVFKLQELLKAECNDDLANVTFWEELVGGIGGGTLATMMVSVRGEMTAAPKEGVDPFRRLPDGSASSFDLRADLKLSIAPSTSPFIKTGNPWTVPFIMAWVNADVVGWSHALRSSGSRSLAYREFYQVPDFKTAFVSYVGLIMGATCLLNPVTAVLFERFVFPKPGRGPPVSFLEDKCFLSIKGEGIGVNGNRAQSVMYFNKDAGILDTVRMLMESALCLALDEEKLPKVAGGFWTPSTALGNVLFDRLVAGGTSFASRIVPKQ